MDATDCAMADVETTKPTKVAVTAATGITFDTMTTPKACLEETMRQDCFQVKRIGPLFCAEHAVARIP